MVEGSCRDLIWNRLISQDVPRITTEILREANRPWGRDLNRRLPGVLTAGLQLTVEMSYLLRQRLCLPFVKFNYVHIKLRRNFSLCTRTLNFPCDCRRLGSDVISTAKSVSFNVPAAVDFTNTVFSVVNRHCIYQCRASHPWSVEL
jgi:hypothetical protein